MKEKEQRKALKETKRKEKETKLIAKIVQKPESKSAPKQSEDDDVEGEKKQ